MKKNVTLLFVVAVALVAWVLPTIGTERPSGTTEIFDYVWETLGNGINQEMEPVQLSSEEKVALLERASPMEEDCGPVVLLGDVLGDEIPPAWRNVPVVSMTETTEDLTPLMHRPSAQVFIGGVPWYLLPPEQGTSSRAIANHNITDST